MLLENRVALVTGGGSGIGRAICLALAREGAAVVVTDVNEEASLAVTDEVTGAGGRAVGLRLDVTDRRAVEKVFADVDKPFGRLDLVCPNAGVSTMNPIVDLTDEEWDFNFNVNTRGVFLVCQAALRRMIQLKTRGKIIITASMGGKRAYPLLAHYIASKFAVIGFMKTLALEAAPHGILVHAVCPGLVRTSMQEREIAWEAKLKGLTEAQVREEYVRMTPLGRLEEPEDVAKVVVLLASSYADFMTGQAINVTGGIETN